MNCWRWVPSFQMRRFVKRRARARAREAACAVCRSRRRNCYFPSPPGGPPTSCISPSHPSLLSFSLVLSTGSRSLLVPLSLFPFSLPVTCSCWRLLLASGGEVHSHYKFLLRALCYSHTRDAWVFRNSYFFARSPTNIKSIITRWRKRAADRQTDG